MTMTDKNITFWQGCSRSSWDCTLKRIGNDYRLHTYLGGAACDVEIFSSFLSGRGVVIKEESIYDAWYLYNMCLANYRKTCPEKKDIVNYINETINDPDCKPTAVLACWRAKMDVMRVPIHWERYM